MSKYFRRRTASVGEIRVLCDLLCLSHWTVWQHFRANPSNRYVWMMRVILNKHRLTLFHMCAAQQQPSRATLERCRPISNIILWFYGTHTRVVYTQHFEPYSMRACKVFPSEMCVLEDCDFGKSHVRGFCSHVYAAQCESGACIANGSINVLNK